MARDGNGKYNIPTNSWYPPVNGNQATAGDFKKTLEDVANALSQSVSNDGQTTMQGSLNMGGNRVRSLGAPQGNNDALRRLQLMKGPDITPETVSTIPDEGNFFEMTGTGTVESFSASFPGRLIWIRFSDEITLKNSTTLVLIGNKDWATENGDYGLFLQINDESWISLQKAPADTSWAGITDKPTIFPSNWESVADKPDTATRWPSFAEITSSPATATRWPTYAEVTDKPSTFTPSSHTHAWAQVTGAPATATRWPTYAEVTGKPALPPTQQSIAHLGVGQLCMVCSQAQSSNLVAGNTYAGSALRVSLRSMTSSNTVEQHVNNNNLPGTWRALGSANSGAGAYSFPGTIAIRIS